MSSEKFKPDPRRVVCLCRSSGCYKGIHIDAMGVSQPGVEVVPATREAHERADKRKHIHAVSKLVGDQDQTRPNRVDGQDTIVSNFDRLALNSHLVTKTSSRNQIPLTNNNQQPSVDSQVLEATHKARETGVNEYDCGTLHILYLEIIRCIYQFNADYITLFLCSRPFSPVHSIRFQSCVPSRGSYFGCHEYLRDCLTFNIFVAHGHDAYHS